MKLDELRARVATVLGVEPSVLNERSSQESLKEWDSMAQIGIIAMLDETVGGQLSADDAPDLTSFASIVNLLKRKGVLTD